ncbi:MAG: Virulence factor MviN [Parcubacteria group bacterium GW2011_GWA2_43_17]|nr:MAG: Virulence factor MviN [Parcubacteria group bacterium GW2011_GWA2_43_17]KKT97178.1 MAG: Virulence factor MviN [Parcubacteria group bacterium GW2011_GWC2_45_15]OGY96324.1 MAG: murein biosynthesis integral membrane protein MurJ [Candidatus Komeilibacteria bacterium RIFOXYC2_FULL_45_12]HAH03984.1 murein biosynthesis integral membrane protein MurJ [Candidatus Komeilibacteria bacterium]HCC73749.1 murein biosynthesis integral membrane protein MurJ [Candidatus Komeilibacteria bacterium]
MLRTIWDKLSHTVMGGAVLITFFTIISKIFGLVRDRLLASYFGAGSLLDSYYAAFKLPDLVFNTLVLGALASAFIPVFSKVWHENKAQAIYLSSSLLNYLLVFIAGISLAMFFLAPVLVPLIAPGFSPELFPLTVQFTRIMLLSIIFFTVSNIIGGILNSLRKFFTFSMAPLFYNLGIIGGITVFYPAVGPLGLAWGVVFGSILHLVVQLPEVIRSGWHYQWHWKITREVKKVATLMIPRTLGLIAGQVNQVVITAIASTLAVGSIAVFNLANNLQSLPTSIFGVSLAIAIFPVFSEALARHDQEHFVKTFSVNFRRLIFLIVPISIFILLLRAQIVRVILGFGNFDWQDTYYTAQTLGWFSVSLFAQCLTPLLARSFYALEDTKTPVIISLAAIILNIAGSITLGRKMGVEGLALAFSLAAILNMLMLLFVLRLRVGNLDDKKIMLSVLRTGFNSLLAGGLVYLALQLMARLVNMQTFIGIFIQGLTAGMVGLIIYLILSLVTNCQEVIFVKRWLMRYLKPLIKESSKF